MPLGWNEIRQRAITFSRAWSSASRERAEAQTFWNEFFDVFGIRRRTVAAFEEPVRNLRGEFEFIDLLWPGKLIAEHKSRGRDLSKASTQAYRYVLDLINTNRSDEAPRYIIVSDFSRFALHDLEHGEEEAQSVEFELGDLHRHIRSFAFVAGYETRRLDPEDDANLKATELLANLHDRLEDVGYTGHDLQRFMVRILFCLFAEDSGIFDPDSFKLFIQNHTRNDGSDLGSQLSFLFRVLDTPEDRRARNLDDDLAAFPYVNGDLYREALDFPVFDAQMREALLTCCRFHWAKISPAVFGSLFQSVMDDKQRRQIGAHYTSERDILKLVRSLFLDGLRADFEGIRHNSSRLAGFQRRLVHCHTMILG
ncbi:MAG: type IIL restriction-modification enzyme MmeI [Tepidisphaeraceae bacterium]